MVSTWDISLFSCSRYQLQADSIEKKGKERHFLHWRQLYSDPSILGWLKNYISSEARTTTRDDPNRADCDEVMMRFVFHIFFKSLLLFFSIAGFEE